VANKRQKPKYLPRKLFAVREKLGASQPEMARLIGFQGSCARISEYEVGKREPNLMVLLSYAKAGGISTDMLIDDSVELTFPENLTTPTELIEWRKERKRIMVVPRQLQQKRLAAKLLQIRQWLKLSQSEIVERLGVQTDHTLISMYEQNRRQPPLYVLLAYARIAGVPLEQIVDDELELKL
jgi:transcriptional regulator with XRE-family HTH domain